MKLSFNESYQLAYTTPETPTNLGVVMDYLISEGFAEGVSEAKVLISAMSTGWWNEICEAQRNAGSGGAGKGARYVQDIGNMPVGHVQNRPAKGGELVNKERAGKAYKSQMKKDKEAEHGIGNEDRKERARANKDKKAYSALDDVLKDIRK